MQVLGGMLNDSGWEDLTALKLHIWRVVVGGRCVPYAGLPWLPWMHVPPAMHRPVAHRLLRIIDVSKYSSEYFFAPSDVLLHCCASFYNTATIWLMAYALLVSLRTEELCPRLVYPRISNKHLLDDRLDEQKIMCEPY
jgi:hypothetical protein